MSATPDALRAISIIADVDVSQIPDISPRDFHVTDWKYLETAVDIRESLMGVYYRAGANVICPNCHRYAGGLFFQRGKKLPTVFRCEYENVIWYDRDADMVLVNRILRKYNAKLWCEK